MIRGGLVHLGVLAALVVAWLVSPREVLPWTMGAVLFASIVVITRLVASPKTQFFVPTVFRGSPSTSAIAFTFDDGPDPTYTTQVLDVLRSCDARATFFVVGRAAEAHPELVRRIAADGHLVGSHSYSHSNTFHLLRARSMADDIARGIDVVEKILGVRPAFFRPPHGIRVPTLRDALAALGTPPTCVTWSVRGMDTVARSAEAIVARVVGGLEPGAIVTLHDGIEFGGLRGRAPTVAALRELLSVSRARGLKCVRLDELLR